MISSAAYQLTILDWIITVSLILVHELGHYIDAKKCGIYKGFFFNGLIFGVALRNYFNKRIYYLGGIIYSFTIYPFALLLSHFGLASPRWYSAFPIMALLLGLIDMITFFAWNKSWLNHKFEILERTKINKLLLKAFGQDSERIIWVNSHDARRHNARAKKA